VSPVPPSPGHGSHAHFPRPDLGGKLGRTKGGAAPRLLPHETARHDRGQGSPRGKPVLDPEAVKADTGLSIWRCSSKISSVTSQAPSDEKAREERLKIRASRPGKLQCLSRPSSNLLDSSAYSACCTYKTILCRSAVALPRRSVSGSKSRGIALSPFQMISTENLMGLSLEVRKRRSGPKKHIFAHCSY